MLFSLMSCHRFLVVVVVANVRSYTYILSLKLSLSSFWLSPAMYSVIFYTYKILDTHIIFVFARQNIYGVWTGSLTTSFFKLNFFGLLKYNHKHPSLGFKWPVLLFLVAFLFIFIQNLESDYVYFSVVLAFPCLLILIFHVNIILCLIPLSQYRPSSSCYWCCFSSFSSSSFYEQHNYFSCLSSNVRLTCFSISFYCN